MDFNLKSLEHEFLGEKGPTGESNFRFAGKDLGSIVTEVIPYLLTAAGMLLLLYLLFGGLQLMLSRGEPKAMQEAQGKISNALVGFLIVFVAYWIVQIIGRVLGLQESSFGVPFNL